MTDRGDLAVCTLISINYGKLNYSESHVPQFTSKPSRHHCCRPHAAVTCNYESCVLGVSFFCLVSPYLMCLPAALLHAVRLRLGVRLLSHQPVRGVQRASGRLRGPGTPPLAAAEPGPVAPRQRDGHARRRDPLADDLQASGPRR